MNTNLYARCLEAVKALPPNEGLGRRDLVDRDGQCCALGAVLFKDIDIKYRRKAWLAENIARAYKDYLIDVNIARAIANENDMSSRLETPQERRRRMTTWLERMANET